MKLTRAIEVFQELKSKYGDREISINGSEFIEIKIIREY